MPALELVTAPTSAPIGVRQVAKSSIVTDVDQDDILAMCIDAAVAQFERETRRALMPQTWRLHLDGWPATGLITVPRPPLRSVSSIKYLDGNGDEQTLDAANYRVEAVSLAAPGRIAPAYGTAWPTAREVLGSVRVEFLAGFGTKAGDVPVDIRMALIRLAADYYEHREHTSAGVEVRPVRGPTAYQRSVRSWRVPFYEGLGV